MEAGVYDIAISSLKLVDVDAHRAQLALIAGGGIAVVDREDFVNHNHTPGRGHPNAGAAMSKSAPTGERVRIAHIKAGDRFVADAKGALHAHYFDPGPAPSHPKWEDKSSYGDRAVGVHTVRSIEPVASRAMGSTNRGARVYDVHTDKGLLRYSSQAKLYRLHEPLPGTASRSFHERNHVGHAPSHESSVTTSLYEMNKAEKAAKAGTHTKYRIRGRVPGAISRAENVTRLVGANSFEVSGIVEEFYNMVHSKADGKFASSPGAGVMKAMKGASLVKGPAPVGGGGKSKALKPMKAPKIAAPAKAPKAPKAAKPAFVRDPAGHPQQTKAPSSQTRTTKAGAAAQGEQPSRIGQRVLSKKMGGPAQTTLHLSEISANGQKQMVDRLHHVGAIPKNLKTADEVANFVAKNVLSVYGKVSPANIAAWKQWYPGANKIGLALSGPDLPHHAANATIAALSPGTDWNINVAQTRAAVSVLRNNAPLTAKQAIEANKLSAAAFGRQHTKWENSVTAARSALTVLNAERQKTTDPKALAKIDAAIKKKHEQVLKVEPQEKFLPKFHEGQKPSEVSDYATGFMMRAVTPHTVVRDVKIKPDGTYDDSQLVMNKTGKARSGGWQSYDNLSKVASIYRDPSMQNISNKMGNAHKVRSFFNNINDPHNAAGDVTVDTHMFGVGLAKPLSISHPWIKSGKMNITSSGGSAPDGIKGAYAIFHEGISRAAKQAGLEPREMQSVVWEQWRRMHTIAERAANVKSISQGGKL